MIPARQAVRATGMFWVIQVWVIREDQIHARWERGNRPERTGGSDGEGAEGHNQGTMSPYSLLTSLAQTSQATLLSLSFFTCKMVGRGPPSG